MRISIKFSVALSVAIFFGFTSPLAHADVPGADDLAVLDRDIGVFNERWKSLLDAMERYRVKYRDVVDGDGVIDGDYLAAYQCFHAMLYANEVVRLTDVTYMYSATMLRVHMKHQANSPKNKLVDDISVILHDQIRLMRSLSFGLSGTRYVALQGDYDKIADDMMVVYEGWPGSVLRKSEISDYPESMHVTSSYKAFALQSTTFSDYCKTLSDDVGAALAVSGARSEFALDMVNYSWQFKIARLVLLESMGWAMVCNYAHRDRDFQGLEKMESIALKALAVRVRRMEDLLGSLEANSRSPQPFIKGDFVPVFRERVVQWRAALDAALASDGLALPGIMPQ